MRDGQRGQLDVVRDAHGLPLIVPIAIGIAGFREAVGDQHGRYRLDALDIDKMQIDGADPAYVSVPQPRKVIEIEVDEPVFDPDLEHDQAVAAVAGLRNAAPMPTSVVATPMVTSPIGTWPALPMPVAMTGEQYLVGEALRGLVQINRQQGDAHAQQVGQLSAMASSTLAAIPPLLLATTAHAERVETLLAELLLRQQGITPPKPAPPSAPPPPPASPQPTPPPAPGVVYAMPRNAAFVDDGYDDGEGDDDLDDAPIEPQGDEDMMAKINKLVAKVAEAIGPIVNVAQMVIGARLGGGLGGLIGGDDSPRNTAGDAPAAEPEVEPEAAEPSLGHLRTSHVLAVSHELGAQDGSILRTMIRAMEPADRRMFVDRLCAMPLDEAVPFAGEKVAWLKVRIARSRARCADAATHTHDTSGADDVIDDNPSAHTNTHQEHNNTQHDADADLDDAPFADDANPDQELDTAQHDSEADDEPTHLDDQEHERDARLGDEPRDDAAEARDADATPDHDNRSPMPALATRPATAPEVPRPVTPDVTAHMKRIAKHLTFTEILQAQQLINSTSITERNAWIERLMALEPTEAATVVRAEMVRRAGR